MLPLLANTPVPVRQWDRAYLTMYAVYVLVGLGVRFAGWMHDDALVYIQASRRVLDGSFDLYSMLLLLFVTLAALIVRWTVSSSPSNSANSASTVGIID